MDYPFTFIILTYNEERNIEDCLDSIKEFEASVFVVDSFSTDNTLEILKRKKVHFCQHHFYNYSRQRNWAQENNPFSTEWVFHLDAGERLTIELVNWLRTSFNQLKNKYDGFMFSRKTIFFGKWIKYGGHYPNYHLRLFKRGSGRCENKLYDQHFVSDGLLLKVKSGIDIIDTVTDNLRDFTISHSKWAVFEAYERLTHKSTGEIEASFFGNPIQRRRWLKNNVFQKFPTFSRSFIYFFYRYFFRLGFLDGRRGLIFHLLQGFWFRFLVDAQILEFQLKMKKYHNDIDNLLRKQYSDFFSKK